MKLKPVEILRYLGFDIPEDGIEINENDAYLVTSALRFECPARTMPQMQTA